MEIDTSLSARLALALASDPDDSLARLELAPLAAPPDKDCKLLAVETPVTEADKFPVCVTEADDEFPNIFDDTVLVASLVLAFTADDEFENDIGLGAIEDVVLDELVPFLDFSTLKKLE